MKSTAELEGRTAMAAAASSAVAPLLRGTPRAARVAAVTPHALLLSVDGVRDSFGPALLCVSGPGAVRLPCSLVVADELPAAVPGSTVTVGAARIEFAHHDVHVGRWWRARRPVLTDPAGAAERSSRLSLTGLGRAVELPPAEIARLRSALHAPAGGDRALHTAVLGLLGLGPGLTPAGDDVLAGALVALTAARHPSTTRLLSAVVAAEPARRTTLVSAGLLAHAARGECVPQLADLLTALDTKAGTDAGTEGAVDRLLTVGHSSGPALLLGAALGIAVAGEATTTTDSNRRAST